MGEIYSHQYDEDRIDVTIVCLYRESGIKCVAWSGESTSLDISDFQCYDIVETLSGLSKDTNLDGVSEENFLSRWTLKK